LETFFPRNLSVYSTDNNATTDASILQEHKDTVTQKN